MRSLLLLLPLPLATKNYDTVMSGGRVLDAESELQTSQPKLRLSAFVK